MKEIITDIKIGWKTTQNSVKFWNGLVLLGLIISGVFSLDLLCVELALMSLFALALFLDGMSDDGKRLDKHIWIYFTPLVWGLLIAALIVMGCVKAYDGTIVKFNNWLNKK